MRWRQLCDSDKIMAEVRLLLPLQFLLSFLSLFQFVSVRVYQTRTEMTSDKLDASSETVPLHHRLLNYRYSSTGQLMPDNDIISEAMGHMYVL